MLKIYKWLLGYTDKLLHCSLSFMVFLFLCLVIPIEASSVLVILLGFAKEIFDSKTGGNCDAYDEVADIAGVLLGIILLGLM